MLLTGFSLFAEFDVTISIFLAEFGVGAFK
jgi:hypothetical protein